MPVKTQLGGESFYEWWTQPEPSNDKTVKIDIFLIYIYFIKFVKIE